MELFNKILSPVDLSEASQKIAPLTLTVAKKFNSEIHLLFVARKFDHFSNIYVAHMSIENFEAEIVKGAEQGMEEFAKEHFSAYPAYKTRVVIGDPSEEILNYVESESMDLLIIGTHGRKGIERIVFGSVANRVIRKSPIPVLSINPYRGEISQDMSQQRSKKR
ncbi:MAG: universal stress protein [Thermodesulfobacteriota bacterium]|nr:universal stress protein [Thermodesulfobacteriota bacterium]